MAGHSGDAKKYPNTKLYKMFVDDGLENIYIELICNFPCNNKEALLAEEGRHIRLLDTVKNGGNRCVAGRKKEEYIETHKEQKNLYMKGYYEANRAEMNAKSNHYGATHREKMNGYLKALRECKRAEKAAALLATST